MRLVDLAAALVYALLCISIIASMSPFPAEEAQAGLAGRSRAYSALSSYLVGEGLPLLASSTPAQICSSLAAMSNRTLVLSGTIDGFSCVGSLPVHAVSSNLTLSIGNRTVEIEAWLVPA